LCLTFGSSSDSYEYIESKFAKLTKSLFRQAEIKLVFASDHIQP